MRRALRRVLVALALAVAAVTAAPAAQEYTGTVLVTVTADSPTWTYEVGAPVTFRIRVTRDGMPIAATVSYAVGPDGFPRGFPATLEASAPAPADGLVVRGGTMQQPGFLRCIATVEVQGKTYRGLATAAFAPERLMPTVEDPPDFDAFWNAGKAALAKIPVEARLTHLPERSTAKADVYEVEIDSIGAAAETRSKVYGILCEPKTGERLPALLFVPGAGMRPYTGMIEPCEKGVITLQIGIHSMPVTFDASVYTALQNGALRAYYFYNLDDRDRYFYRRVYLGCLRANDFLVSRPRWDGRRLAVTGGSQGGALSIVTAALDPRVIGLAASYPALADMTGYRHGRAGGWPHMFRADQKGVHDTPQKLATVPYYDVVNFARRLRVPGIYSWGFNDETVPPTSAFAAYNVITAPKRLLLAVTTGHARTPEQIAIMDAWLEALLFPSDRDDRIDAHGAPGRRDGGGEAGQGEEQHDAGDGRRIGRADAVQQALEEARQHHGRAEAQRDAGADERRGAPQDESENGGPLRAERETHADLVGPLRHVEGEQRIDAERRQHERRHREQPNQAQRIATRRERLADEVVHRPHLEDRERRVDRLDVAPDHVGERRRLTPRFGDDGKR